MLRKGLCHAMKKTTLLFLSCLPAFASAGWTWDKSANTLTADGMGPTPAGTVLATQTTGLGYGHGIAQGQIEIKATPGLAVRTLDLSEPVVDTDGNPATIESVQRETFVGNAALRRVSFPASLKYIGPDAFRNCSALQEIGAFPDGLVAIGAQAFQDCAALTTQLSLPAGLTELGSGAFRGSSVSGDIVLPAGLAALPEYVFAGTRVTSFRADAELVSVGRHAFDGCTALHTAVLDEGLTTLGAPAQAQDDGSVFYGCSALVSCNLPSTLTFVGSQCFRNSALSGDVVWPATAEALRQDTFSGTRIASFTAPTGLRTVAPYAFRGCTALAEIVLPDTLESVGAQWLEGAAGRPAVYWRAFPSGDGFTGAGVSASGATHHLSRAGQTAWESFAASEANAYNLVLPSGADAGSWAAAGDRVLWWDDSYAPADPIGLFVR